MPNHAKKENFQLTYFLQRIPAEFGPMMLEASSRELMKDTISEAT
jgi:hypothetical protein